MLSFWLLWAAVCQLQSAAVPQATTATQESDRPVGLAEILETKLPPYTGTIIKIDREGVRVHLPAETRSIPFDRLLKARFAPPEKRAASESLTIELSDGSTINGSKIESDGTNVRFKSGAEEFTVTTRQVDSCLLKPLPAPLAKQWQAIVDSRISADVLVLNRSAEALDKIEGIITSVSDQTVKFQFDGQTIDVQRSKLAGWRFFAPEQKDRPKLLAVVRDRRNSIWMVESLTGQWANNESIQMKLVCGAEVKLQAASITEIDFSFGSMRFLADLEPIERKVPSRLALATAIPESEQLFGPRPTAAATQRGAAVGPGIEFAGSGTIVYRVPTDFRRLMGTVSLTPEGTQFVPCKAQIMIEEKVVWEKTLTTPQEVIPLEIEVDSGKRLRLTIQAESRQPVGDHVSWRQLRFVK